MKNTAQIEIIEKDIANAKQVLKEDVGEKIRECFKDLKKLYADQDESLSFRSSGEYSEINWSFTNSGFNKIPDYLAYKKDLQTMIRKLELYCAKLKDMPTHTPNSGIHISNNHSISTNATINQAITLAQTLQSIQEIPSSSLSDEDKERLEDLLASIKGLKNVNKEKTMGKISEVLRFVADKGIDVGIAVLPWILEVMRSIG